jgi:WD40 repeat protein
MPSGVRGLIVDGSAAPGAVSEGKAVEAGKLNVFISYSRDDLEIADQLDVTLELAGFVPTLDRHGISGAENWQERLGAMIRYADSVVFVLSPASAKSDICKWEVGEAARLGKRIIPIAGRPLGDAVPPPALAALNYIYLYPDPKNPSSGFRRGTGELIKALKTDLEWMREHTRLLQRAIEWEQGGRQPIRLLSGSDIPDAKAWVARRPKDAPAPTELHLDFVKASEDAEAARENAARRALEERARLLGDTEAAQAKTARLQQRAQWGLALIAGLVVIAIAIVAWQYLANVTLQASLDKSGSELLTNQRQLQRQQANVFGQLASVELLRGNVDDALRFSAQGARLDLALPVGTRMASSGAAQLAAAASHLEWRVLLRGHEEALAHAAFSPDGARIVTASVDKTARIWDAATGNEIKVLRGQETAVLSAAFSPDGTRIVTALLDNTARIWNTATGNEIQVLRGHESAVVSAAFSPDGTRIVTASADKTARIWDAATGNEIKVLRGHEGVISSAAFSPDGTRIVTASNDKTARIWDAATGNEIKVLGGHNGFVSSAAFSPDGTAIVTASWDKTVRIWDAVTGNEIKALRGHESAVASAAFSPDGAHIVTASADKTARIWDAATGKEIKLLRGHEDYVNSAVFSPDGTRIVTASNDNTARIWDAVTGNEIRVMRGHDGFVSSAAFSPDGTRIVTASFDSTARIWDAARGNEIRVFRGPENPLFSADFSPDGTRIVTASSDNTARIWDAATGNEIKVLRGHDGFVSSAAFSPDGTAIVTASFDNTARIWDAATGDAVRVTRGHDLVLASATFNPTGTRILTASLDETARVWDAATGSEIKVLRGHEGGVNGAAFSPDGTRIVTASRDRTARIWDARFATMSTRDLLVETCARWLVGISKVSRDDMRLLGYPDDQREIDVCEGVK